MLPPDIESLTHEMQRDYIIALSEARHRFPILAPYIGFKNPYTREPIYTQDDFEKYLHQYALDAVLKNNTSLGNYIEKPTIFSSIGLRNPYTCEHMYTPEDFAKYLHMHTSSSANYKPNAKGQEHIDSNPPDEVHDSLDSEESIYSQATESKTNIDRTNITLKFWRYVISRVFIIFAVAFACYLLFYLPYSRATASPDEETRIGSQSIDPDLSDSKTSSGGNTGTGREFPPPENSDGYIGNTSTKKFHEPSCSYLPDAANRIYFDTRDEALDAGYSACRRCYP